MELIQKGITGALLVGGVGTAGYYASGGPNGTTIEDHIRTKKRELISSEDKWKEKGELYKRVEKEGLVSGLDNRDRRSKGKVKEVWEFLREWCQKTQKKYFTNIHDSTYQGFSAWCLSKITIKEALTKEGLQEESDWSKKVGLYKEKNENFIKLEDKKPPSEIDNSKIQEWCTKEKDKEFKHEAEGEYARVKEWCFVNPEPKTPVVKGK
ncbi:hypothetical protein HF1_14140 [Mycoplasma haemofelis str. Langford 1]|uniref:Uncharacterized protein n=1 Tax=Mycoplasma haemofelis (strain Langford 1) TaxID=941640 RepID=E8ZJV1_MYCHL|nr:hypothetical protein [Mycoplasma haemofelis]CBY93422.1 hypothetical protein HF1_14140 [Mycoplasma haemofelis str. Langford 1]